VWSAFTWKPTVGQKKAGSEFGIEQPNFGKHTTCHTHSESDSVLGRRTPNGGGYEVKTSPGETAPDKKAKPIQRADLPLHTTGGVSITQAKQGIFFMGRPACDDASPSNPPLRP
jgi:hypothetical protein